MDDKKKVSKDGKPKSSPARERFKKIDKLRKELADFEDIDDAIIILNDFKDKNKEVIYLEEIGHYRYVNYYILPGFRTDDFSTLRANLRFLNKFGYCKTSAPELITYAKAKNDLFSVVILKLNNTRGGTLQPVDMLSDVPKDKMTKFIQEQLDLLEKTGIYNNDVINGFEFWFLTPDTKNVFIDNWGHLSICQDIEEKKAVKKIFKKMLKYKESVH